MNYEVIRMENIDLFFSVYEIIRNNSTLVVIFTKLRNVNLENIYIWILSI